MRATKKSPEPEGGAGAPEWMVTFSDCMTLLLTFFVLLLSFSSFDENLFKKLKVFFSEELTSVNLNRGNKSAMSTTKLIKYFTDLDKGSEKPTLEGGKKENLKNEDPEPVNFHDLKVFLIPSGKIFWGSGMVISFQGRKALSNMASFLKEVPNRVVISENGQGDQEDKTHLGLQRAWAIIEYLTTKQGLDKGQFSIAVSSLQKNHKNTQQNHSQAKTERILEIVLLERSIYN